MQTLRVKLAFGLLALVSMGLVPTTANSGQRPISDFVSRQGMWSLQFDGDGFVDCAASAYDGGFSGFVFVPPIANFVNWTAPQDNTSAMFDYAGLVDAAAGGTLGTKMSGSVNEVVHQDGSVTVSIVLKTTHAAAWASTGFDGYGTMLFGSNGLEILAGATPAFGSSLLRLVINGPAAEQPLPDFSELLWGCGPWSMVSVDFFGSAKGTLPDGTPAELQVTEVGLLALAGEVNHHSSFSSDAFPAEQIRIRATGHLKE